MQEQDLKELGIFRIPVPIPFPQAGGPANIYVIEEDEGILLFDTGLGTEPSLQALAEGLSRIGRRFEEVNRIVLSHGHVDHYGAASWIMEQAGHPIPIHLHSADADNVLDSGDDWPAVLTRNRGYLLSLGMPAPALEEAIATLASGGGLGRRLSAVDPLQAGQVFRCRRVTLEVHHMPGHTPGVCCLYDRAHRLLFSADHLLENVSPNPLMDLRPRNGQEPLRPLISYFQSLDRVRALAIDLVLPGHAAPFPDPAEVIESLTAFYARRQDKILHALKRGPMTVFEVMRRLFPLKSGFELVLTMSEALGNLEVLEDRGAVERYVRDGLVYFR